MSGGPESPRAVATWTRWGAPILVAVVTLAAFLPALEGEFVNWDDQRNFVDNPSYRGLGWAQLRWMFTTTHMGHYIPLTWLTLGLDHVIWGMRPFGYHLTSLVLHVATALAFYALSRRLLALTVPGPGDLRLGSAAAALLFAVHPLRVESVAWVTERRDVLSGLFYVCALLAYLRAAALSPRLDPRWRRTTLVLYVAALLSKSITVTLPFVLLVLDVYPLRRLGGARGWRQPEVWLEKVPFVLVGAAFASVAFLAVMSDAHLRPLRELDVAQRIAMSVYGVAFYLFKTAAPIDLSPLYQLPVVVTWLHVAVPVLGTFAAVLARRRAPWFAAAWAAYLVTIGPVLGIFHNGPQVAADRYSYLACIGWALLAGAAAARRWAGAAAVRAVLAAIVLALMTLTWQQSQVWRDSVTLWRQAVAVNPASRAAHANLARGHAAAGDIAPAIAHLEEALRLSPNTALLHAAIGELYERAGIPAAALLHYAAALRVPPVLGEACLGVRRLSPPLPSPPEAAAACP